MLLLEEGARAKEGRSACSVGLFETGDATSVFKKAPLEGDAARLSGEGGSAPAVRVDRVGMGARPRSDALAWAEDGNELVRSA